MILNQQDNFLHTTHRTVTWFRKTYTGGELELSPPFQRNAVWTNVQKSYLIDTILNALPIPELYMQDVHDESGGERHVVVDGQQRIRAVLDFTSGTFSLEGDDVAKTWRGLSFEDLTPDQKMAIFAYKFVVRILPGNLVEEDIRKIFARINKNTAVLTDQEIRNATYWGPFIKTIQRIADDDPYWAECGIFSANDHRRMLDHEFISELAIAHLHGAQNKKDKVDHYYRLYEENFDSATELEADFRKVTSELARVLPKITGTRWKKKSDFYTLFLEFSSRSDHLPYDEGRVLALRAKILEFGELVDGLLKLEESDWTTDDKDVLSYARNVARAASDRNSRIARSSALSNFVFGESKRSTSEGSSLEVSVEHEGMSLAASPGVSEK